MYPPSFFIIYIYIYMEYTVYTTGVYDTFHIGHYNFLKKASKYGYLIVGVTSDYLVEKEKIKYP